MVPDNLKSGVNKAHIYEPDINPTYQDLADHYQVAIIPARKQRPRDKAKAETGVMVVSRWILARLRNHTFFSLAALNREIASLLSVLNQRQFRKLPGTRMSRFEELDKPALQPLPEHRYEYAEWKKVRVNIDYHVEIDRHYYSVPYQLVKKQLDARITAHTVEIFHHNKRVASHKRSYKRGGFVTVKEHQNLIITGPTGIGKSWLACALAHKACREGYSALYTRLPRLLQDMGIARGDGRYPKLMKDLAKTDLLILDDWGLAPLGNEQRRDLLEILEDRHGLRSTLVTSQLPVESWHEYLDDLTLADAILDRLIHNAHRMNLRGESMRKKKAPLTTESGSH